MQCYPSLRVPNSTFFRPQIRINFTLRIRRIELPKKYELKSQFTLMNKLSGEKFNFKYSKISQFLANIVWYRTSQVPMLRTSSITMLKNAKLTMAT